MRSRGARNVLIKGGHMAKVKSETRVAKDYLFIGEELTTFEAEFIETTATHGTGCVLSAAIAANLALGNDLVKSVRIAKDFVTKAICTAPNLGKGNSPINN
jgi:hydroxymethylpyrimidine/phosphomethylpyrimidine kinase